MGRRAVRAAGSEERRTLDKGEGKQILLVLVVCGGVLLAGLGHGLPEVYVPDTHIVRNALGMAAERNPWPPAGAYSTYPYLLAYLLLPLYAATFLAGRLAGCYASAEDFGVKVVENPTVVYLEARLLVVFFGLAAVFFLYRIARRLGWTTARASAAALFLGVSPLFVQFAHQARPWIPVTAGVTAALYFTLRAVQQGRGRDWAAAFACAGMTFAMHQVGGSALLLPASGFVAARGRRMLAPRALAAGLGLALVFAGTALALGYGHLLLAGPGREVIATEARAVDLGGQKLVLDYFTGALAWKTARALFGYAPLLCGIGVPALVASLLRPRPFRGVRAPMTVFTLFTALLFLMYDGTHVRYFLPLLPVLALGLAWISGEAAARLRVREGGAAFLLLLLPLVQTLRLDLLLCREDTRDRARAWIEARIAPGARVAVEGYGPHLHPDRASLRWLEGQGVWLRRRERLLLEGRVQGEQGGGGEAKPRYFVIPLERFYAFKSYWPHQYLGEGEKPIGTFLHETGAEWIVLADQWPEEDRHPPLVEFLAARTGAGPVFSPAGADVPPEANLPLEMRFAITALWRVERPGPVIRLFHVKMAREGSQ